MKTLSILVADDNVDGQAILGRFLRRGGHQPVFVSNGRDCVDKALSEEFDLLLLDMNMPILNGWEAAEKIRVRKSYAELPIIAFTAHAMQGDREKCLDAGCTDYLTKPIDFGALSAILKNIAGE